MDAFTIASVLIVLSALFGYVNVRYIKLPTTIGLMIIAIVFTIGLFITSLIDDRLLHFAEDLIKSIPFETVLLDVMLGFLLFAGALHTDFNRLKEHRWPILMFSTLGVLISTFLIGTVSFYLFNGVGLHAEYIHCLLFGALISPTDPIAVLGIMKQAGVSKKLEIKIVGESLFNDGIGVVLFLTIMNIAGAGDHGHGHGHGDTSVMGIVTLFGKEVLGGLLMGGLLGFITYRLMRRIDDYDTEVLITLACVMGGYTLGHYLGVSAPLAMVVAGLVIGHEKLRRTSMSERTELYVDKFWELLDLLLNAVLFVLIGLELLILKYEGLFLAVALISIFVVLFSRYLALLLPVAIFKKRLEFVPNTGLIMTWGGLRGGISIALALSLPEDMPRDLILMVTYVVVVFSIVVQGLTLGKVAQRLTKSA